MKPLEILTLSSLIFLLPVGCELGNKNVGQETDDGGSSSGDAGSDDSATSGGDGGSASSGVDGGSGSGGCVGEGCYAPCEGKTCGQICDVCAPDDPACVAPAATHVCDLDGQCVPGGPAVCGPYDPCLGEPCGTPCSNCAPWDPDCAETAEEKVCDGDGLCVSLGGETCAGPSLEPGFESDLSNIFGCGDTYIYAVNPTDTVMLSLSKDAAIEAAAMAGMPIQLQFDLSMPGVGVDPEVIVELGQFVSAFACSDVIENKPDIIETWRAISGTLTLDVDVPDMFGNSTATATLTDVVVELDNDPASTITIGTFSMPDVSVGWLPG